MPSPRASEARLCGRIDEPGGRGAAARVSQLRLQVARAVPRAPAARVDGRATTTASRSSGPRPPMSSWTRSVDSANELQGRDTGERTKDEGPGRPPDGLRTKTKGPRTKNERAARLQHRDRRARRQLGERVVQEEPDIVGACRGRHRERHVRASHPGSRLGAPTRSDPSSPQTLNRELPSREARPNSPPR